MKILLNNASIIGLSSFEPNQHVMRFLQSLKRDRKIKSFKSSLEEIKPMKARDFMIRVLISQIKQKLFFSTL